MVSSAGIVLAGGRSARMGAAKAALEWHGGTLLGRVAGVVGRAVDGPVFVVAAPGQDLPALPPAVRVLTDPQEGRGPLQGLAVGLRAAASVPAPVAFVAATDLALLHPAVVRRVLAGLHDGVDVAMPVVAGRRQPLLAAYRTALAAAVAGWVAGGERRVMVVPERSRVNVLDADDLLADPAVRAADPGLRSLANLNDPREYRAARARAAPAVTVAGPGGRRARAVRAATLAAAVVAAGQAPEGVSATVDGAPAGGEFPLVAGDVVALTGWRD